MPSERDESSEYEARGQADRIRFPIWVLIVALLVGMVAALVAVPVLIILVIDLQRLFEG